MKILNTRKLQQVFSNPSSDIDFKGFTILHKYYSKKPYSFLVNDTTLSSDNRLRSKKRIIKMSISEKTKTIYNKIEQNKT